MQESFHLAKLQQGGLFGRWLAQVHHQRHVRTHVFAVLLYPLALKLRHPRTVLLALAWIEVYVEHGKIRAVGI